MFQTYHHTGIIIILFQGIVTDKTLDTAAPLK